MYVLHQGIYKISTGNATLQGVGAHTRAEVTIVQVDVVASI